MPLEKMAKKVTEKTAKNVKTGENLITKTEKPKTLNKKTSQLTESGAQTVKRNMLVVEEQTNNSVLTKTGKTRRGRKRKLELDTEGNKPKAVKTERGKRSETNKSTKVEKTTKSTKKSSEVIENACVEETVKPSTSRTAVSMPTAPKRGLKNTENLLKISSWNVAGLRSWFKKGGLKFLKSENSDIFCLQEIKCTMEKIPQEMQRLSDYHAYWLGLSGGYAGVALLTKIEPLNVKYGIGNSEFDRDGRLITAEFKKFFLLNVYVPNSGRKLVNLASRMRWEKLFQTYVQKLDAKKPLIICGDMNVSLQEIDLANPKSNVRTAGFTMEERQKMSELLALGFLDTFRQLYPNRLGAYTYWTYIGNARARNVGWRLDYFIVSKRIGKRVIEHAIRAKVFGSDHCPITLFIDI